MRYALILSMTTLCSTLHAQSWHPLFDGYSFAGWTTADGGTVKPEAWEVVDGMLHLDRSKGNGGNLLTVGEYGDFELVFEWKVAPKANNGIKYRVRDFDGRTLGLEYQVIDDYGQPNLQPHHRTASIYDIYDAKSHTHLRPANVFNRGRILVRGGLIQHWLNGHLIAEAHVGSEEWNERIARSKFAKIPGFGVNQVGRIMLTDHKDEVWYRNIFIREFGPHPVTSASHQTSVSQVCGVSNSCVRGSFVRRTRKVCCPSRCR